MSVRASNFTAYGFNNGPLIGVFPFPIVSKRSPTTADFAQIGTLWIESVDTTGTVINSAWVLTSIINNSANWADITGGSGSFSSLTVTPGPISLTGTTTVNITGAANTSIGTGSNTGTVAIGNATSTAITILGPTSVNATGSLNTNIGATSNTGTVSIGNASSTAVTVLGPTNINTTGARNTGIGSTSNSGTVSIGNASSTAISILGPTNINTTGTLGTAIASTSNSGALSIGNASSGAITITSGTGNFSLVGGGNTIGLANDTAANIVTLGSTTGIASTTIKGGSGGIIITPTAGNISVAPAISTLQTSLTPTLNSRLGSILVDGTNVTVKIVAGSTKTFAITNSTVTATSIVFATASSTEAIANVQLEVIAVQTAASTLSIIVKNNGGTDTGANYNVNFWVMS